MELELELELGVEVELGRVASEADAALAWLAEKEAAQATSAKYDAPVLRASDIVKRGDTVARVCDPILAKPAPKPEEPAKAAEAAPAAEGEAMDADEAEVGPPPPEEAEAEASRPMQE